ncbi:nucleotide disphospho-sugar-binding domain-containing protein [Streptomyces nondiastaticus]|uniref:nucleotide disphospho-sugar-binding domain-containing protein n=1 Tax=Streptomyces nondiastaticus TaxID=3154512 RepID=UPI00341399A3
MRILITALAPSHLMGMVPFAWAARAAGHDVLAAGRAEVAATAQQAGLPAAGIRERQAPRPAPAGTAEGEPALPRMARALSAEQLGRFAGHTWAPGGHPWQQRVGRVIDDYLETARAWRPDVILCDPIEFAGLVTGALLDLPVVIHRWGGPDSMSAEAIDRARSILDGPAAALGLRDGIPAPAMTLDPCPPSLRLDATTPVRSMRYVPYNGARLTPRWLRERPSRRRVCVTFGLFGSQAAVSGADFVQGEDPAAQIAAIARALESRPDLDVLVTAPEQVRRGLDRLPDGFDVVDHVPLGSALGHCDLVIHHGGTGTAMTAAALGVPQLVLPPEHPALADCARGVALRGVGRRLDGADRADPVALRAEITELLDRTVHREHAQRLAEEISAQPSPADLVPALEECVRDGRPANGSTRPGSSSRVSRSASPEATSGRP